MTSTLGHGSTFTVYLPVTTTVNAPALDAARAELAPAARGTEPNRADDDATRSRAHARARDGQHDLDDHQLEGMKVLLVDDDFRNIFALTALLERGHAEVTAAESGTDALAALERVPDIDIVLMDIMMPGMDGYETMRAVRALDQFRSLPILAVTGKVVPGERDRCIQAGANDYLPKPVSTEELLAAIGPWLPALAQPTT